ncbi:MAG TPA: sigma-70 family RNA polymerase sigma factor [Verrucomicrobiota bacterium]|nr:sigma-70 family RNA polymerase sigma factor [Verrucomicrobiota bacterium]
MIGAGSNKADNERHSFNSIEAMYLAYEPALLRYAKQLVKDDEKAQDIVQEAFMRLHVNLNSVKQPKPYLYRTVHNISMNQIRNDGKVVQFPSQVDGDNPSNGIDDAVDTQPLPDEQISKMEAVNLTRLCLKKLDERSQQLVRLKFEEGLSYKDISERTGLSVSNVGYILHNALKDVAAELKKAGVLL